MLYYIFTKLYQDGTIFSVLRVFNSITIRAMLAFILAFLIVLITGKPFINYLRSKKIEEGIRDVGPESHFAKKGTPTMGGVLIVMSLIVTNLITGNLTNKFEILLIIITILFSIIGFVDDFVKWRGKNKDGISGKAKLLGQTMIAVIIFFFVKQFNRIDGELLYSLANPFVKDSYIYMGAILYFIFIVIVITGTSNAVNLTDGLDGLVTGPVMIAAFVFGVISYFTGHVVLRDYLNLYDIAGSSEMFVFISSVVGACLGFLWYNTYPAQIFMGDTGSLTLGGVIGTVAILLKQELLLPIVGLVFVVEATSVILQVGSYRFRKKRIFKMAPIHHHFELLGIPETKVTMRFWIVSLLCGIVGLIILKIR